ncbi:MAG: PAS domain S-box protein [Balneolaceae bacterium]|nr:PAS domain S-box protein [Balneolaceae bacterium]
MKKQINILREETALLHALPGSAAIIDKDGEIIASNENWENGSKCSNWLEIEKSGDNYFEHCKKAVEEGNDYALKLLFGIREVLDGERASLEMTMAQNGGPRRWCKVSVSKINSSEQIALIIFDDVTANMRAIHLLRESEERYSQQFQYSVSGIILGSPEGEIFDANPAACKILGYSKEELIEGGRQLIVDESNPAHIEMLQVRDEESVFEGEKEYTHRDGHTVPVEIISVTYKDEEEGLKVINTFRDITLEKQVEHFLEEERRFTKTVLNSIPGIFFVLDSKGKLIRWNESIEKELGYNEDELQTMSILEIFKENEREKAEEMFNNAFEHGNNGFVTHILSKHNGDRTYHIYVNRFISEDEEYLVSTGVDITEFLASEHERERNFALMTQLFENSPLAMVMIDKQSRVQKVNNGFTTLFGYDPVEVLGKNVNKLITEDSKLKEAEEVSKSAITGQAHQQETLRLTKHQNAVPVLVSTVPIWSHGEVIAAYGIYVDLTEQKKLERDLQTSLNEKNILLQELHHRVKNNLAIIAGLLELQVIYENNIAVKHKLEEAHSRIFSIAKIHETLYQQKDVVQIEFNEYLDSIIGSMSYVAGEKKFSIKREEHSEPFMLNLNQAVPLGLVINELIQMKSTDTSAIKHEVNINLTCNGNDVQLEIDGFEKNIEELESTDESYTFHKLLIDTFIKQIDADIRYSRNGTNSVLVHFKRTEDLRGSSSAITSRDNLFKNKKR